MSQKTWEDLRKVLVDTFESENVIYQPPKNIQLTYPVIIFRRSNLEKVVADDTSYLINKRYEIKVISKYPDHKVLEKLLAKPYCSYERGYISDGLYHDVLNIYY